MEIKATKFQWLPDVTRPEGKDYSVHRFFS